MKISELEAKLAAYREAHGDIDVMVASGENVWDFYETHEVAEAGEYPADWNMPEGFEFIKLSAFD